MRVLLIGGKDLSGGGHIAAFRLHQALRKFGIDSIFAVRTKLSDDPFVHKLTFKELGWPPFARGYLDMLPRMLLSNTSDPISLGLQGIRLQSLIKHFNPDVLHLHWVNAGLVSIRSLKELSLPIVWTLHDMWPFTGGCHYAGSCVQFEVGCPFCPQIKPISILPRMARWVHTRKLSNWRSLPLQIIAPSSWMEKNARLSLLFSEAKLSTIPYCIDPDIFNSSHRTQHRKLLGLSNESKAILFVGANQERKGATVIPELLRQLSSIGNVKFLFAGGLPQGSSMSEHTQVLPGTNNEATMAGYYAASDLYVLPSFQDNLPNTVIESLACGTPVAAFPTGGIPEMIEPGVNGELSLEQTAVSLAAAIERCLGGEILPRDQISAKAHETYCEKSVAARHLEFYQAALDSRVIPK